jgi:hypothetical protein
MCPLPTSDSGQPSDSGLRVPQDWGVSLPTPAHIRLGISPVTQPFLSIGISTAPPPPSRPISGFESAPYLPMAWDQIPFLTTSRLGICQVPPALLAWIRPLPNSGLGSAQCPLPTLGWGSPLSYLRLGTCPVSPAYLRLGISLLPTSGLG